MAGDSQTRERLAMFDDAFATATLPEIGGAAASSPPEPAPDPLGARSAARAAEPADASRTTPSESESPGTSEGHAPDASPSGASMAMFDAMFSPAAGGAPGLTLKPKPNPKA